MHLNSEGIRPNDESDRSEDNSRKNRILYLVIGISVLLVIIGIMAGISAYSKSYVASIGNMKVTIPEYRFALTQEKANMLDIAGNPDPETFWNTIIVGGEKAIDIAKRKALESVRDLKIQLDKAEEKGIKLDETDLDYVKQISKSILAQYNNDTAEANAATREVYGVSLKEFEDIYKQLLLRSKYIRSEIEATEADESEIETYYAKFPDAFKDASNRYNGEEAVWVKHILVLTIDENNEQFKGKQLEEARKKAEELLQRAKSGENFAQLAIENSEDPGSAEHGGDYVFGRGYMETAFEEAAFSLEPGEISDLVKTNYGYHIIKLEEKIAQDEPVSLRCAKEYPEFQINAVKFAKFMEKMEEWKKDAKYQITENRKVYESIK